MSDNLRYLLKNVPRHKQMGKVGLGGGAKRMEGG